MSIRTSVIKIEGWEKFVNNWLCLYHDNNIFQYPLVVIANTLSYINMSLLSLICSTPITQYIISFLLLISATIYIAMYQITTDYHH